MMTRGIIYFSAGWIFASAQADTSTTSCYDTAVLGAPFGGAIFNQRSPRANDTTFQHDHGDHLTAASCHASRTLHGPANAFSELQRKVRKSLLKCFENPVFAKQLYPQPFHLKKAASFVCSP